MCLFREDGAATHTDETDENHGDRTIDLVHEASSHRARKTLGEINDIFTQFLEQASDTVFESDFEVTAAFLIDSLLITLVTNDDERCVLHLSGDDAEIGTDVAVKLFQEVLSMWKEKQELLSHSVNVFDFVSQPIPELADVYRETEEEYEARKEESVQRKIEEREQAQVDEYAPYQSSHNQRKKEAYAEKKENGEVSKQNVEKLMTTVKLRWIGIDDPSKFIDLALLEYDNFFYKSKGDELTEVNYKSVVSFAKKMKDQYDDPTAVLERMIAVGINDKFVDESAIVVDVRKRYEELLDIPDDHFQVGAAALQNMPWLVSAWANGPDYPNEIDARIAFLKNHDSLSQAQIDSLATQNSIYGLAGGTVDKLHVALNNPQMIDDIQVVARELHMIMSDSKIGFSEQLRNVMDNSDLLANMAYTIRTGFRLEKEGVDSFFGSQFLRRNDMGKYSILEDEPLSFTEEQRNLAGVLNLNTIESYDFVLQLEALISDLVETDYDIQRLEAFIYVLNEDKNEGRTIEQYTRLNRLPGHHFMQKWARLDDEMRTGDAKGGRIPNEGKDLDHAQRASALKKILTRALLFSDEGSINTDLITSLMHPPNRLPIERFLDEETIALLPVIERTMVRLLLQLEDHTDGNLWTEIIESKDELYPHVNEAGQILPSFVEWYFSTEFAGYNTSFRDLAPLFENSNLPMEFINHMEKMVPTLDQFGEKAGNYMFDIFTIFMSEQDEDERDKKLALLWQDKHEGLFIRSLSKKSLKAVFGDKRGNDFLSALPRDTNERRNAFLHNDYDRTTKWLINMLQKTQSSGIEQNFSAYSGHGLSRVDTLGFSFNEDIGIATEFIDTFGLADNPQLFVIFKALCLVENDASFDMPAAIIETGVRSKQELLDQYNDVLGYLVDAEPLVDLADFSEFQKMLLSSATGRDTHSFSRSDTMSDIITWFSNDVQQERITPPGPEHSVESITFSDIEVIYEPSDVARRTFDSIVNITNEIFEVLSTENYWQDVTDSFRRSLLYKEQHLSLKIENIDESKAGYLNKQLLEVREQIESLSDINSIDSAMSVIGSYQPDKQMTSVWEDLVQRLVFYKMIETGGANQKMQSLVSTTNLSPKSLLTAVNIYDEVIKHHVINFSDDESAAYWDADTRAVFSEKKNRKKLKRLTNIFQTVVRVLKEDVDTFEKEVLDSQTTIDAIPDKGLIGEMSGYIANACYTNETSMLANWDVTPYKFVDRSKSPVELIGTVLLFDVALENGESAVLVRAINIPEEEQYDIEALCEAYIDKAADVAKAKGATTVLVPGKTGAMSNYQLTINHLKKTYCENKDPVSLAEPFVFNGYDLQDSCYVARIV